MNPLFNNPFPKNILPLSLTAAQHAETRTATAGDVGSGADGAPADAMRSAAAFLPPYSNTGRKLPIPIDMHGIDEETGEPFQICVTGTKRINVIRHLVPVEPKKQDIALIDALAFSIKPPEDAEHELLWVVNHLKRFMMISGYEAKNGLHGFAHSIRLNDGLGVIAWGGESQRGKVWVSLMGAGCSTVHDWPGLTAWLEEHQAKLTRVDVAHDDFEGQTVNMGWAIKQYEDGGFNAGGRNPAHELQGDWLLGEQSRKGRTLYIGNRSSGKYFRAYEKGKQLGDPESGWVRVEVEWRSQDRVIPYDILLNPSAYLAGAYPCLAFLDKVQHRIKTTANAARISFDFAIETAKKQYGKLINLMLKVFGGDFGEVIDRLRRDGYPQRIEPYSYHIRENPSMLVPEWCERYSYVPL